MSSPTSGQAGTEDQPPEQPIESPVESPTGFSWAPSEPVPAMARPDKKPRKGLITAAVVALLAVAGGGAYFATSGSRGGNHNSAPIPRGVSSSAPVTPGSSVESSPTAPYYEQLKKSNLPVASEYIAGHNPTKETVQNLFHNRALAVRFDDPSFLVYSGADPTNPEEPQLVDLRNDIQSEKTYGISIPNDPNGIISYDFGIQASDILFSPTDPTTVMVRYEAGNNADTADHMNRAQQTFYLQHKVVELPDGQSKDIWGFQPMESPLTAITHQEWLDGFSN